MADDSKPHFDIHPQVVLKLGEELIADEFTAIVEAAKNAYDAGATRIRIKIDTDHVPDERYRSKYPRAKGTLSISDDGSGMDEEAIKGGWLFIAYSRKKDLKREAASARKRLKRVPLGDKGIGRLGLQRIGDNVEVFTSSGVGNGHHVAFSWNDFETAKTLTDVLVVIEPAHRKLSEGTEILVSGLKSPSLWKGNAGRDRLQSKLSQMVSPFDELRECEVEVTLNGSALDLAQFSRRVLSVAEQHFSFEFDGQKLRVKGEFSLEYFKLATDPKYPAAAASIERDDGKALVQHLSSGKGAVAAEIEFGKKESSRLVVERTIDLESLGGIAFDGGSPVSPGPFHGELFHFDKRARAGGFDRANDFKEFLDTQRGVRIYRNGFAFGRYGVDGSDWLGLGESWTSASSWFGLKPGNIIGYVSISAADNPLLEEKTDREGLTDSPAAANFIRLVHEVVDYANAVNAHLRRGLGDFEQAQKLVEAGETRLDPETVTRKLGKGKTAAKRVKEVALRPGQERAVTPEEAEEVSSALSVAEALTVEVERLKLEGRGLTDLAGLGLTAEALSHEIANIADRLAQRVKALGAFTAKSDADPRVVEFVEHVRSAVAALRKQLAHLAPSLRFAREKKERFDLRDFLKDQGEFFSDRLSTKGISLKIDVGDAVFPVRMSRGKLTQVVDNLVLNSEYWLEEGLRRNSKAESVVKLRLKSPHLLVSDSGPGVDPSVEGQLFQPFVTLKPKGRGLGLFIVRQLLDSMGCSVALKGDRNSKGRRYIFDLDLSGALDGGEDENG